MSNPFTELQARVNFWLEKGWEKLFKGFYSVWTAPSEKEGLHGHLIVETSDSVGFLVMDESTDSVIMVKQKRKPMVRPDNPEGWIIECPAGRFDHSTDVRELIAREASEEVGVTIKPESVIMLNNGKPLALSPGVITERMWLGIVKVGADQIDQEERTFGADPDEEITRVRISLREICGSPIVAEDMKSFALLQSVRIAFHNAINEQ